MVRLIFPNAHREDEDLNNLLASLSIQSAATPTDQAPSLPTSSDRLPIPIHCQLPPGSCVKRSYPNSATEWIEYPILQSRSPASRQRRLSTDSVEQYADPEIDYAIAAANLSQIGGKLYVKLLSFGI